MSISDPLFYPIKQRFWDLKDSFDIPLRFPPIDKQAK